MNRAAVIALATMPFAAVAAGVVAGRLNARPEEQRCTNPTMNVTFDGQVFSAAPDEKQDALLCNRDTCFVDGPEKVEIHRDAQVSCVTVLPGTDWN